jgi:hypothetical protein
MIDLEKSFSRKLKQWGYNILLQRKLENGNYKDTLEQVTTRSVFPGGMNNARSTQEEDEGVATNSNVTYYFEASVNPGEGDRIYEMIPNVSGKYTIYVIDTSSPMRGRGGKIVFWTVGATKEKQV